MNRNAVFKKSAPPIAPGSAEEEDNGAAAHQVVRLTDAASSPRPATTAAPSIFAAGQAAKPRRKSPVGLIDPDAIEVKTGVPIPPRRKEAGPSPYAKLFERMPVGSMVELPRVRANGFMGWAKKHADGQLVRRVLRPDVAGVWKVAKAKV